MASLNYDDLFRTIETLVLQHSPSGVETEIDRWLLTRLEELSVESWQDDTGNIVARIPGQNRHRAVAITAHKDEIGAIVKTVQPEGQLEVRKLGSSFPGCVARILVEQKKPLGKRQLTKQL